MKKNIKGITLVALVITIVILLILTGIAIGTLGGENGLITKVTQAKDKYSISEVKEKLELKISELRLEEEGKGETLTKEDLPKLNSDEIDVGNVENFPVEVICEKYKFNVDENFVVTYVGEANQTIITYTTEPEGYTNQDKIEILIKVSNPKGIKNIEYPDGDILIVDGAKERGIDYKVTANGTYQFKVVDTENNEVIKDVVIDQIDKSEPLDFTISYEKTENGVKVIGETQDAEPDEVSTKSGIDHYEYYVIESSNQETKYETNKIENLALGNYKLYVIAFDKAGNSKKSNVVEFKISIQFKDIVVGNHHTLALDYDNKLWSWGNNNYGQLGYETVVEKYSPVQIKTETTFKQISAGGNHSLAIDSEGNLWAWGSNDYGQLGDGTTENKCQPTKVMKDTKFEKIFAGKLNSFAIDNKGNVWACGYNAIAQLGDETTENRTEFVKVFKNINVKDIACDGYFTLVLDEDGKLYSVGSNSNAQLGDGTKTNRATPVHIKAEKTFKQISAGGSHSLAIDSEGNLWSWGFNRGGQLGDGTSGINAFKTSPVQIMENIKFTQISVGEDHSFAIDTEGNLWAWGRNLEGNIGDGSKTQRNSPVQIKKETKFSLAFASYRWSLAIDNQSNLWMWGDYLGGRSSIPVQVY